MNASPVLEVTEADEPAGPCCLNCGQPQPAGTCLCWLAGVGAVSWLEDQEYAQQQVNLAIDKMYAADLARLAAAGVPVSADPTVEPF